MKLGDGSKIGKPQINVAYSRRRCYKPIRPVLLSWLDVNIERDLEDLSRAIVLVNYRQRT